MKKRPLLLLALLLVSGVGFTGILDIHAQEVGAHNGYWCFDCHRFADDNTNLKWVAEEIVLIPGPGSVSPVYLNLTGPNSLADGDSTYDGACEVCHTQTAYHRNNSGGDHSHYAGEYCTECHKHFQVTMFAPTYVGPQSHETHLSDPKGPEITACTECHSSSTYSLFADGKDLANTDVCNPCHSKDGSAFDGVDDLIVGAKPNWEQGIYEADGSDLKSGKENWCATCHDGGMSNVKGVEAPNVMGDNVGYGYNVSGHGHHAVLCKDCHDLTVMHTDGDARTYSAAADNYRSGYRLSENMAVPRNGEIHPEAFRLCTNCHVYTDITGSTSNFRDDGKGMQFHEMHLNLWPALFASDSDFDGVGCNTGTCRDSAMTCINCHNVHGPPNGAMIRHGELISTPGTTDKVPALDFRWYKADGVTQTAVLGESRYGGLICGVMPDASVNHVCSGCHPTEELKWYRSPAGALGVYLDAVWTSNLSNVTKTVFAPNENIRYHARFTLVGPGSYFVKVAKSGAGNTSSMPGTDWVTKLYKQGTVSSGTYEITWDKTIPGEATPDSPAKLLIQIGMFDTPGGTLLSTDKKISTFSIASAP